MHGDVYQRASALFGMGLVMLIHFEEHEILKTVLLAGLGGGSSYLVSQLVRNLISYIRCRMKRK